MNEVYDLLNPKHRKLSFNLIGKAFYGKKNKAKDGSYTTTLWMSFCYFPIFPYDTYRMMTKPKGILPTIFKFDDFIYYRCFRLPFDWYQVAYTFTITWGAFLAFFYSLLFIGYEYGSVFGWGIIALVLAVFGSVASYNYFKYIRPYVLPVGEIKDKKLISAIPAMQKVKAEPGTSLNDLKKRLAVELEKDKSQAPVPGKSEILPKPAPSAPAPAPVKTPEPVLAETKTVESEIKKSEIEKPVVLPKPINLHKRVVEPAIAEKQKVQSRVPVAEVNMPAPVAIPAPVARAEAVPPNQIKFDPNKILEWNPSDVSYEYVVEDFHLGFSGFLGCLTMLLIVGQVLGQMYFRVFFNHTEELLAVEKLVGALHDTRLLGLWAGVMFLVLIRRLPGIAVMLLGGAIIILLQLQDQLIDYLVR